MLRPQRSENRDPLIDHRGGEVAAIRRKQTAEIGIVPRGSAYHPRVARWPVLIFTPLNHIAAHVIQSVFIRGEASDRARALETPYYEPSYRQPKVFANNQPWRTLVMA